MIWRYLFLAIYGFFLLSCKQEPKIAPALLAGTYRVVDQNIPYPFLLEIKNDTFFLINHKNEMIDHSGLVEGQFINRMEPGNGYTSCHGEPCNLLKGQALYKLRRFEEAVSVFQEVLKVEEEKGWDPLDNFHAHFYMARCHSELQEYDKALQLYQIQPAQNEKFTEAHYQMGRIYNLLGEEEKAKPHLEKAKELLVEGYKMGEPYYEAFDEVFLYQVEEELARSKGMGRSLETDTAGFEFDMSK